MSPCRADYLIALARLVALIFAPWPFGGLKRRALVSGLSPWLAHPLVVTPSAYILPFSGLARCWLRELFTEFTRFYNV